MKYKVVLVPVQVPNNNTCNRDRAECQFYYGDAYGHPNCKLGFDNMEHFDDDYYPVDKPKECKMLRMGVRGDEPIEMEEEYT